ncbi:MAG: hypothetical protein ACFFFC_01045 [Candidatus Thorarchaeota archaeon]
MFGNACIKSQIAEPVNLIGRQEKILLAAIIRRTAFDIALYKNSRRLKERNLYIKAYQWMFTRLEPRNPLDKFVSFTNVCELLGKNPDWIREQTLKLKKSDVKKFDRVGL